MTKITFQIVAVIFLLLLLPLHGANAQQDVASLTGEVTDSSGAQVADAHHRIAMVLRRLAEHGQAAEHLATAIKVWEENGTAEEQFVELWRQELKELRSIHRNSQERRVPPG